ncbi:MAG: O-methyltransferase [Acidobacteriales bacterium]|nr:O-methyltransferase [Terriglobales bacterium]
MKGITDSVVDNYLYSILPERDEVLREIEGQAAKRNIPIVGPAVGRLLYQLSRMINGRTVFEMGSAVGYSTIWWARAVGEGGRVVYTDGDEKNAEEARGYFRRAGVADRIDVRVGDALEILSEQRSASYDVIFNDVDKEDYPRVLRLVPERVRKGGLFVTDNVLWSGRVARVAAGQNGSDPELSTPATKGIVEFNQLLYASKDFFTTMLPLRDGVAVSLRV